MEKEIINEILIHNEKNKETIVQISTGYGKQRIIEELLKEKSKENKEIRLLILTDRYIIQKQLHENIIQILKRNKICPIRYKIMKYNEISEDYKLKGFDVIILDNAHQISEKEYRRICNINPSSNKVLFYTVDSKWLNCRKNIEYKFSDIPLDIDIQQLFIEIFKSLKFYYSNDHFLIYKTGDMLKPDFYLEKDNINIIVEIKNYRDRYISNQTIDGIISRAKELNKHPLIQEKNFQVCFILLCEIDEKIKNEMYNKYKITILDIRNLIYICQTDKKLMERLEKSVYYSIKDIKPQEILNKLFEPLQDIQISVEDLKSKSEQLIDELLKVSFGKIDKSDKKYEKICTKIIKYLFETEFTQIKEQSGTDDELFVMDLICGIKGSNAFWRILIEHYNTRFVVFEYKNYQQELTQNNIFITEKYLFNSALRNVAILISRMGLSKNAVKATEGILKEEGKLIISLTDEDLIIMLKMKEKGEEPSDYLLEKLENFLMSIGK